MVRHGLGKPPTYSHWVNMKTRCLNKNNPKYKSYGARGIKICKEWVDNFVNFHYWAIENGFKEGLSLERIDVNGNYCPNNCCWITMAEQAKNKTTNINITFNGMTKNLNEWTKYFNLGKQTLRNRFKLGWTVEEAMTSQKRKRGGDKK